MAKKAEATIRISVDGQHYTFRPGDVTALDAQALRRATGMSMRGLWDAAQNDPDIDVIASLVWLARRAKEPSLSYETVAKAIGYDSDIAAEADAEAATPAADEEDAAFPEA